MNNCVGDETEKMIKIIYTLKKYSVDTDGLNRVLEELLNKSKQ